METPSSSQLICRCIRTLTVLNHRLPSCSRKGRSPSRRSCDEKTFSSTNFLRHLKLIQRFICAGLHQVFGNHSHRRLDLPVYVKVFVVHKTVESLSAVEPFDLRETRFNRIELRRITDVLDLHDIKFFVSLDNLLSLMHSQLIHVDSKPRVTVPLSELLQVPDELCSSDCLIMNVKPFQPTVG